MSTMASVGRRQSLHTPGLLRMTVKTFGSLQTLKTINERGDNGTNIPSDRPAGKRLAQGWTRRATSALLSYIHPRRSPDQPTLMPPRMTMPSRQLGLSFPRRHLSLPVQTKSENFSRGPRRCLLARSEAHAKVLRAYLSAKKTLSREWLSMQLLVRNREVRGRESKQASVPFLSRSTRT